MKWLTFILLFTMSAFALGESLLRSAARRRLNVITLTVTAPDATPGFSAVRFTGPWWGWDPNGGPEATSNGDGTWSVTMGAPTENMEYLWVVDGSQESLVDNAAADECTEKIGDVGGDGSLITDYANWANRVWVEDTGDAADTYDSCAVTSTDAGNDDIEGCMDDAATNYDEDATVDDGSCVYELDAPEIPTAPVPTDAADSVLSIFSDAYTDQEGTDFNPNWGQSTSVEVGENLAYTNLNYQGTDFASSLNVSPYLYLHVSYYVVESTSLNFYLISPGSPDPVETAVALDVSTTDQWVNVQIPLADYSPVNLADVIQFKVDGNGDVKFNNIYFGGEVSVIEGCTVETALNYNENADVDDGSCTYPVSVTFRVNMAGQDISNGVSVAGGAIFGQAGVQMLDNDGDGIYTVVAELPENTVVNFKYRSTTASTYEVGLETVPAACNFGDWSDRQVIVGQDTIVLDVVAFGQCDDEAPVYCNTFTECDAAASELVDSPADTQCDSGVCTAAKCCKPVYCNTFTECAADSELVDSAATQCDSDGCTAAKCCKGDGTYWPAPDDFQGYMAVEVVDYFRTCKALGGLYTSSLSSCVKLGLDKDDVDLHVQYDKADDSNQDYSLGLVTLIGDSKRNVEDYSHLKIVMKKTTEDTSTIPVHVKLENGWADDADSVALCGVGGLNSAEVSLNEGCQMIPIEQLAGTTAVGTEGREGTCEIDLSALNAVTFIMGEFNNYEDSLNYDFEIASVEFTTAGDSCIEGCTDDTASNYNENADVDDGSCIFLGCTDADALNYDAAATLNDGSCVYAVTLAVGDAIDLTTVTLESFGGTDASIADGVLTVVKNVDAETWAGVTIAHGEVVFPLTATDTLITADVYSTVAATIRMKLENSADGNYYAEVDSSHTGSGWETLTFDFAGTNAIDANFDVVVLFPNFGVAGAGNTYEFDNIVFAGGVSGCTDAAASNYNAAATVDDGSCNTDSVDDPVEPAAVSVTFKVDMFAVGAHADGVFLAGGNFGNEGEVMTNDGNDVWSVTLDLNPNAQYLYKFRNRASAGGDDWGGFEEMAGLIDGGCVSGEYNDRFVDVAEADIVLPVVAYGSCTATPYEPPAAPTLPTAPVPTDAGDSVLSIFSTKYGNLADTDFNPDWNQATSVDSTGVNLVYTNLNYQGTTFDAPLDVFGYDYLHVSYYVVEPFTGTLNFYLVSPGSPDPVETAVALDVSTTDQWVNVQIPLADYSPVDLADVIQFKVEVVDGNGAGAVAFNNLYFTNTAHDSGSSDQPGDDDSNTGPVTTTTYCETPVTHFNIEAETASAVFLTVERVDTNNVDVSVTSADAADPVDLFIIGEQSNPAAVNTMTLADGTATITLDWAGGAPATASFEVLWSKESTPGNWMLRMEDLPNINTAATCDDSGDGSDGPEPTGINLVLTTDGTAVRLTGPWWGWDTNGGPEATSNGDGTWTVTLDPAPTDNMQYLWVVDGVQEDLVDNVANAECTVEIDGGSLIDYSDSANRVLVVGSGDAADTYDACVGTSTTDPNIPASPVPTDAADSVLSIFSDAYTDQEGTNFNPNWGQATVVTVDDVLTYNNLNYQGTDIASSDVSGYAYIRLDFYTADATDFQFTIISPGAENLISLADQIVLDQWVTVEIALADFVADLTAVNQLKVVGNGNVYLDNIYFGGVIPDTGSGPITTYCATEVTHFNIADHPGSIFLTVENSGADSMTVTATSVNDVIDVLIIESVQGGGTASATTIADGVATAEITWDGTMPATTSFGILWSDGTSGGNQMINAGDGTDGLGNIDTSNVCPGGDSDTVTPTVDITVSMESGYEPRIGFNNEWCFSDCSSNPSFTDNSDGTFTVSVPEGQQYKIGRIDQNGALSIEQVEDTGNACTVPELGDVRRVALDSCDPIIPTFAAADDSGDPEPTSINLVLTADGADTVRLTGPWWGWDVNGGPEATSNGDGTWTVTLDPVPTENMEYLWVVGGVQESLFDNAANAECAAEIDGGSLITDYAGWANRVLVVGSGDAADTYDACAGTSTGGSGDSGSGDPNYTVGDGIQFTEAFGGTTIGAGPTFTFPPAAETWGGFVNMDTALYPITVGEDSVITFTGSVPTGADVVVRFRFEANPYPNTEPSFDTETVTVSGADVATYSIDVPSQGANTFNSLLMYLDTRDVGVSVTDVAISAAPSDTGGVTDVGGCVDTNALNYDPAATVQAVDQYGNLLCRYVSCDYIPDLEGCIYDGSYSAFNEFFNAENCESYGGTPCTVDDSGSGDDTTDSAYCASTNTGVSHTLFKPPGEIPGNLVYISVSYRDGDDLIQAGCASVNTDGTFQIAAYGDDLTSDEKDGFEAGEEFIWRGQTSAGDEVNLMVTYTDAASNAYTANGINYVETVTIGECQTITLPAGWSMFSTYLTPFQPDMATVLSNIDDDIIIVKNNEGLAYLIEWNFNGIGDMQLGQGYQIKMDAERDLEICGTYAAPESTDLTLTAGWNMIGYLRKHASDTAVVFEDVVADNNLVIVKDEIGRAYLPEYGFNGIGDMAPGKGYQVKIHNGDELTYAANGE